ncbi:MAG: hypothetical protein ACRC3Z_13275 [Phocaeicola sp.]
MYQDKRNEQPAERKEKQNISLKEKSFKRKHPSKKKTPFPRRKHLSKRNTFQKETPFKKKHLSKEKKKIFFKNPLY